MLCSYASAGQPSASPSKAGASSSLVRIRFTNVRTASSPTMECDATHRRARRREERPQTHGATTRTMCTRTRATTTTGMSRNEEPYDGPSYDYHKEYYEYEDHHDGDGDDDGDGAGWSYHESCSWWWISR